MTGAVQCTAAETAFVSVSLIQSKGPGVNIGSGSTSLLCDGTVQAWTVLVTVSSGTDFSPGPATGTAFVSTSGVDGFDDESVSTTIKLTNH